MSYCEYALIKISHVLLASWRKASYLKGKTFTESLPFPAVLMGSCLRDHNSLCGWSPVPPTFQTVPAQGGVISCRHSLRLSSSERVRLNIEFCQT